MFGGSALRLQLQGIEHLTGEGNRDEAARRQGLPVEFANEANRGISRPLHAWNYVFDYPRPDFELPVGHEFHEQGAQQALVGRIDLRQRHGAQTRTKIRKRDLDLPGQGARRNQKRKTPFARDIEEVEQDPLVAYAPVDVLDSYGAGVGCRLNVTLSKRRARHSHRSGLRTPDLDEMALARTRRPRNSMCALRPVLPVIDGGNSRRVDGTDKKILAAKGLAVLEIERQLSRTRCHI